MKSKTSAIVEVNCQSNIELKSDLSLGSDLLKNLYQQIESIIPEIDIQQEADLFVETKNIYDYVLKTPYYKALAAYCKSKNPSSVLEIGTCTGISAVCIGKYASKVLTIDVSDDNCNFDALKSRSIVFKKIEPEYIYEINFSHYDFIFIDIDHTGEKEIILHNLLKKNYTGVVFWDDVMLNEGMKKFWNSIDCPKITTNWHSSGFGMVEYCLK
jgi:predicted O-methyltransferase YrrM